MPRMVHKLSPARVQKEARPGLYSDGAGLYLNVGPTGSKSWIFRFSRDGKAREMGLGALHTIGLSEARDRARECRKLLLDGADPIAVREAAKVQKRLEDARAITFKDCALRFIKSHSASWSNEKHSAQWTSTLETYTFPLMGKLAVGVVNTGDVCRVLEPIWAAKPETASRVRGRIEAILDYARTHGWRVGENPARWKGHLENIFPARGKVAKVEHHAALPWREIGAFMASLEAEEGLAARALEFAIATAARTGEALGATWSEVDLDQKLWTIPAERMKAGREHRVPLNTAAIKSLEAVLPLRDEKHGDFVFPGRRRGRALSNMAMLMTLRRMKRDDLTAHGFRSTFRDWVAEATSHPGELAEMALAHTIDSKVEAAYRRGDLMEKRRAMMDDWANYCGKSVAK